MVSPSTSSPLNEGQRAALLAFAAAAFENRPVPYIDDADVLLELARAHGLVGLAHRRLRRSDCPDEIKQVFRIDAAVQALRTGQMQTELANVLTELTASGVAAIILKGPALGQRVYPYASLRPYGDLDLLVREEDWQRTHVALLGLGYRCVQSFNGPPPKVTDKKAYYHTQYVRDEVGIMVEVHYDLWWYGLRPTLGEQLWQRAVPVSIGGVPTQMVDAEEEVIHLSVHLQHHGYRRLIWFTDLALLLRSNDALDWDFVVRTAKREGLSVFVYYSLTFLEQLLGVAAPPEVLRRLRPTPLQRRIHERFWPAAKVLGLEADEAVRCDFHEVPHATELLRNFVLVGRRLEKLRYLSRLLAPSSDWLGFYYGTTDPAVLARRRLMHGPKLIGQALTDLFRATLHAGSGS